MRCQRHKTKKDNKPVTAEVSAAFKIMLTFNLTDRISFRFHIKPSTTSSSAAIWKCVVKGTNRVGL